MEPSGRAGSLEEVPFLVLNSSRAVQGGPLDGDEHVVEMSLHLLVALDDVPGGPLRQHYGATQMIHGLDHSTSVASGVRPGNPPSGTCQ